jgi:hypothetical protein
MTGENRNNRGKTFPNATLSTTNPTWTDPGSNPGPRSERPATNRLKPWHGRDEFAYNDNTAIKLQLLLRRKILFF